MAYNNVGNSYRMVDGVEIDTKKAKYYYGLAAMGGNVDARYNLGRSEENEGKMNRALKHFMIAARAGDDESLTKIQLYCKHGYATEDDSEKALRAHKEATDEMTSDQREAAVASLQNAKVMFGIGDGEIDKYPIVSTDY